MYSEILPPLKPLTKTRNMSLKQVAKAILNPNARIAFLIGAGISTASGIPDFRSPGGMYDTLKPELLTCSDKYKKLMSQDPTYVVSWEIFQKTSLPYLEVRRPFILGINDITPKEKLTRVYSQNIDGKDDNVGLPTRQDLLLPRNIRFFQM